MDADVGGKASAEAALPLPAPGWPGGGEGGYSDEEGDALPEPERATSPTAISSGARPARKPRGKDAMLRMGWAKGSPGPGTPPPHARPAAQQMQWSPAAPPTPDPAPAAPSLSTPTPEPSPVEEPEAGEHCSDDGGHAKEEEGATRFGWARRLLAEQPELDQPLRLWSGGQRDAPEGNSRRARTRDSSFGPNEDAAAVAEALAREAVSAAAAMVEAEVRPIVLESALSVGEAQDGKSFPRNADALVPAAAKDEATGGINYMTTGQGSPPSNVEDEGLHRVEPGAAGINLGLGAVAPAAAKSTSSAVPLGAPVVPRLNLAAVNAAAADLDSPTEHAGDGCRSPGVAGYDSASLSSSSEFSSSEEEDEEEAPDVDESGPSGGGAFLGGAAPLAPALPQLASSGFQGFTTVARPTAGSGDEEIEASTPALHGHPTGAPPQQPWNVDNCDDQAECPGPISDGYNPEDDLTQAPPVQLVGLSPSETSVPDESTASPPCLSDSSSADEVELWRSDMSAEEGRGRLRPAAVPKLELATFVAMSTGAGPPWSAADEAAGEAKDAAPPGLLPNAEKLFQTGESGESASDPWIHRQSSTAPVLARQTSAGSPEVRASEEYAAQVGTEDGIDTCVGSEDAASNGEHAIETPETRGDEGLGVVAAAQAAAAAAVLEGWQARLDALESAQRRSIAEAGATQRAFLQDAAGVLADLKVTTQTEVARVLGAVAETIRSRQFDNRQAAPGDSIKPAALGGAREGWDAAAEERLLAGLSGAVAEAVRGSAESLKATQASVMEGAVARLETLLSQATARMEASAARGAERLAEAGAMLGQPQHGRMEDGEAGGGEWRQRLEAQLMRVMEATEGVRREQSAARDDSAVFLRSLAEQLAASLERANGVAAGLAAAAAAPRGGDDAEGNRLVLEGVRALQEQLRRLEEAFTSGAQGRHGSGGAPGDATWQAATLDPGALSMLRGIESAAGSAAAAAERAGASAMKAAEAAGVAQQVVADAAEMVVTASGSLQGVLADTSEATKRVVHQAAEAILATTDAAAQLVSESRNSSLCIETGDAGGALRQDLPVSTPETDGMPAALPPLSSSSWQPLTVQVPPANDVFNLGTSPLATPSIGAPPAGDSSVAAHDAAVTPRYESNAYFFGRHVTNDDTLSGLGSPTHPKSILQRHSDWAGDDAARGYFARNVAEDASWLHAQSTPQVSPPVQVRDPKGNFVDIGEGPDAIRTAFSPEVSAVASGRFAAAVQYMPCISEDCQPMTGPKMAMGTDEAHMDRPQPSSGSDSSGSFHLPNRSQQEKQVATLLLNSRKVVAGLDPSKRTQAGMEDAMLAFDSDSDSDSDDDAALSFAARRSMGKTRSGRLEDELKPRPRVELPHALPRQRLSPPAARRQATTRCEESKATSAWLAAEKAAASAASAPLRGPSSPPRRAIGEFLHAMGSRQPPDRRASRRPAETDSDDSSEDEEELFIAARRYALGRQSEIQARDVAAAGATRIDLSRAVAGALSTRDARAFNGSNAYGKRSMSHHHGVNDNEGSDDDSEDSDSDGEAEFLLTRLRRSRAGSSQRAF
eukprot:jgi/Tetstr1/426814/TSEL_017029.t1